MSNCIMAVGNYPNNWYQGEFYINMYHQGELLYVLTQHMLTFPLFNLAVLTETD